MASNDQTTREIERICRESYGRLVAYLAAGSRDLSMAEDALADAFSTALTSWPSQGVPDNPDAWLLTAARRKLIDGQRRAATRDAALETLGKRLERTSDMTSNLETIPDDRLKLMFACSHPAIEPAIRTPLILQVVLGIDAATIAGAFLVAPKTMGQRLSRAKAKIRDAGISFRVPDAHELPARLHAVHEAIYAAFGLAWELVGNAESRVQDLGDEAIWLARITNELLPNQPETMGLLALLLYSHARKTARRSSDGSYIPLDQQDVSRWNENLILEADQVLRQAAAFKSLGPYQLEAAIQSVHASRRFTAETDWPAIVDLYQTLREISPTIGASIGFAAALAKSGRLDAAQIALDQIDSRVVQTHQPFWATQAYVYRKSGNDTKSLAALDRAITLSSDPSQRRYLESQRTNDTDGV